MHGEGNVIIELVGDTFDDCAAAAMEYTRQHNMTFIPPFDDYRIIEGQGTVGKEIMDELSGIDYVFFPVGGGGLIAGAGTYIKRISPDTKIIGLEPEGAPSMRDALLAGHPITLQQIDRFVDGAAVKRVGDLTFEIARQVIDLMHLIPEGKVCSTILKLYNEEAIVVEPAGALTVAALDSFAGSIRHKKVVCVISGSNNDIDRMPEIKERSLQFEGLKHYFLIRFAQRPGALKEFVNNVLGPTDDITRFEYMQKTNKESGPALVGIELEEKKDYTSLLNKMQQFHIDYTEINKDDKLYGYLI
jgi:threonine dehydratase